MAEVPAGGTAGASLDRWCSGCGTVVTEPEVVRCPATRPGDDIDHLLEVPEPPGPWPPGLLSDTVQPFVRYRQLLYPWRVARHAGLADDAFLALVADLDARVAAADSGPGRGHGFRTTPLVDGTALAGTLGLDPTVRLLLKDETGDVSGSHKARHLFGLGLHLRVLEALGRRPVEHGPLAIASCGNAALGAAVVAAAGVWPLEVFVPPWADPATVARLSALGAGVAVCERRAGETGDPCVLRYREAVDRGAVPFATQGPENGLTLEGGATLGYELADQLAGLGIGRLDRLYVQVGGGALAAALVTGLHRAVRLGPLTAAPELVTVQAAGAAPLLRAHRTAVTVVGADRSPTAVAAALGELARHRSRAMWAWEDEPVSVATGILDDETYDWRRLVEAMLVDGGRPLVVSEHDLVAAHGLVHRHTTVDADATGTAGLAGVVADALGDDAPAPGTTVVALLTGATRGPAIVS